MIQTMTRFLAIGLAMAASGFAAAAPLGPQDGPTPLILSFDGKGIAMGWDLGVIEAFLPRFRREAVSDIYYVGTSSGSILATYFACHGLNAESVARLEQAAQELPKDVLDEAVMHRMVQLFLGIRPEISRDKAAAILNLATDDSSCVPTAPLLYVAANLEVLDSRIPDRPFSGRHDRHFDPGTYEVSQNGRVIGKACTYFVNEPMAGILKALDPRERLCDLRVVRTGAEVRMGIDASISEPTYFPPVPEPDPTQVQSVYPVSPSRTYNGGFVIDSPVQDVKRVMPMAFTVETGRAVYSRLQNRIIENWFSFPSNRTLLDQHWWPDFQVPITTAQFEGLLAKGVTPVQQAALGKAEAERCFTEGPCIPSLWTKPHFFRDTHGNDLEKMRHRGIHPILR
jgi:hypothetical protein